MRSIDAPWEEEIVYLGDQSKKIKSIRAHYNGSVKTVYYGEDTGTVLYQRFSEIVNGELFTWENETKLKFCSLRFYYFKDGKYVESEFPNYPSVILCVGDNLKTPKNSYYFYWYKDSLYGQTATMRRFYYEKDELVGDWIRNENDDREIVLEMIDDFHRRAKCVQ